MSCYFHCLDYYAFLLPQDRRKVVHRLKAHVEDAKNNPLLIFPEGTCVNNEYIVQFKKGAFELVRSRGNRVSLPPPMKPVSPRLLLHILLLFLVAISLCSQGITVIPIAIKYNNISVDAYWHSRKQSFTQHLFSLMTSWAVVCDVWYMEPQNILPGEDPRQFAER